MPREHEQRTDGDAPESLKTEIVPFERDLLGSPRRPGRGKEEEPSSPPNVPLLEQRTLRLRSANGNGLPPLPSLPAWGSFVKRAELAREEEGGRDLPERFLWRELRCHYARSCNDVIFSSSSSSFFSIRDMKRDKLRKFSIASSIQRKNTIRTECAFTN